MLGIVGGAVADVLLGGRWPYLAVMVLAIWVAATLSMMVVRRYLLAAPKYFMAAMVAGILLKMLVAMAAVFVVIKWGHVATLPAVVTMLAAYFAYTVFEIRMLTRMVKTPNYPS